MERKVRLMEFREQVQSFVFDSVTHLDTVPRGASAFCASHSGAYAAALVVKAGLGGVILNDAGVGLGQAGIAGLQLLQECCVPGATIGHRTARIGDGPDGLRRGRISYVNALAADLGVEPGMSCAAALRLLSSKVREPASTPKPMQETRLEVTPEKTAAIRVFALDSNALVAPGDAGHIVLTGSHGGVLGNAPGRPVKANVWAAVYNDADRGADDAGISRLPPLDAMGIAGACVSAWTAHIGNGMSTYEQGVISAINETARRRGARLGSSTREFVYAMIEAHSKERQ